MDVLDRLSVCRHSNAGTPQREHEPERSIPDVTTGGGASLHNGHPLKCFSFARQNSSLEPGRPFRAPVGVTGPHAIRRIVRRSVRSYFDRGRGGIWTVVGEISLQFVACGIRGCVPRSVVLPTLAADVVPALLPAGRRQGNQGNRRRYPCAPRPASRVVASAG